MELTGKQRRRLRALGHDLHPIVQVGKEGLSEAVRLACDQALSDHELVKVKIGQNAPGDRHAAAAELSRATSSALVQVLGKALLLFRPRPADDPRPRIALDPVGRKKAARKQAKDT
jgi:RNA-binding protein